MGSIPQYLTSVFGGAYVIFRVPEGEAWDPVNDENMKTTDPVSYTHLDVYKRQEKDILTYTKGAVEKNFEKVILTFGWSLKPSILKKKSFDLEHGIYHNNTA